MQAIVEKKLFMLDYHDLFLPYVSKVREIKGTTLYGSRTLFFLTKQGTLKPLAIELTRPIMDGKPQWKQVFTPASHSTDLWLYTCYSFKFSCNQTLALEACQSSCSCPWFWLSWTCKPLVSTIFASCSFAMHLRCDEYMSNSVLESAFLAFLWVVRALYFHNFFQSTCKWRN